MEELKNRKEINEQYKWKTEDIFSNDEAWESEYARSEELIAELSKYEGKLAESADILLSLLKEQEQVALMVERLYVYAHLRKDEDTKDTKFQGLESRARTLYVKLSGATSYVTPEILEIPEEKLEAFYEEKEEFRFYKKMIDEMLRTKAHILSKEQEEVLAQLGEIASAPSTIFGMINNADMKFPTVKDENGNEVQLTQGRYIMFLESPDRNVREAAFKAMYETYGKQINTIGATLAANVKKNATFSRIRKYPSTLEGALHGDNIKKEVYENLIKAVKNNFEPMHRYVKLRKELLGVDELHMYDLYTPLVSGTDQKYTFEEAYKLVMEGLKPLGDDYVALLEEAYKNRWIDVYETEGKRSGAYCSGCYGTHPFVLLNFNGTLDSVFTTAHEMGHAMHSYYSDKTQPYTYAQYTIFVAEVASTVNEILLMHHLLGKTEDKKMKKFLVNEFLEKFRGTVYRQTMFAEFEKVIHEKAENGEALTPDTFNEIYKGLNEAYYGAGLTVDDEIKMEWARIPHFYSSFYVYKYATGFSAAVAIAKSILEEGKPAVDRYKEFLKSGGTDHPTELLKIAGVDMTSPEPIENALKFFGELVGEFENLSK